MVAGEWNAGGSQDGQQLVIVHFPTSSMASLVTRKVYDFARLKVGKKTMWFSVALSPADQKKYAADPRFASAKKNQFHWKVPFSALSELNGDGDLFHCAYTWAHQQP